MTTPENILDPEISDILLAELNLDHEISTKLISNNFTTIGDVYGLQAEGIALVLNISYLEAEAFWNEALEVISNPQRWSVAPKVIESEIEEGEELLNLTKLLPDWVKVVFEQSNKSREYTILYHRLGLDGSGGETLESVGIYFNVTRERIRQVQNTALKRIKQRIFLEDSEPEPVIQEILKLKHKLEADGTPVKTETEIFQTLTTRYGTALTAIHKQHYRLLFTIFNWEEVKEKTNGLYSPEQFWIVDTETLKEKRILDAGAKLVRFLQKHCIKVDYFTAKVALNSKRLKRFSDLEIRTAIKVCPDIEQVEDDYLQLVFHSLKSAQDMAFRVLGEIGEPDTLTNIYREISNRLALAGEKIITRRTISNAMANDARFVAIGKSEWALDEWEDVTLGTVVDHMKQFFYQHNRAAKAKEIYEFVSARRKVSRNSISTYLVDRDEFVRVDRGLYELTEWGGTSSSSSLDNGNRQWTKEKLAETIVTVFESEQTDRMPVPRLILLLNSMGVSQNNIYSRLRLSPAVNLTVISERPRRLEAKVVKEYSFKETITLRDRVEESVRETLLKQPDYSMPLVDLRNKITKRGNIHPYTFYGYLSDMIDIQKNVVPGSKTVIVTLVTEDSENVADVWDSEFTYDIAISYAGPQREYASKLAEEFRKKDLKVFYDRNQLPDLVGRNLLDELLLIYRDKARLCVILASEDYNESSYAQHERRSAQERDFKDPGYIVLTKLDNCKIKGFHSTVAYLEWHHYGLEEIADLSVKQLHQRSP